VPTNQALATASHLFHAGAASLKFSGLATADGAQPSWDRASGTCSNVYCHGGGTRARADTGVPGGASTLHQTPSWTGGPAEVGCGFCHSLPPRDARHAIPGVAYGSTHCVDCHSKTMTPSGDLIRDAFGRPAGPTGGPSFHLNGVVDGNR
jgi:predicted CxxxxCH...CXXCH cytochrome family protein